MSLFSFWDGIDTPGPWQVLTADVSLGVQWETAMSQWLRTLVAFAENLGLVPSSYRVVITIHNPSSVGSDTLFWHPGAAGTHIVHITHIHAGETLRHLKTKLNQILQCMLRIAAHRNLRPESWEFKASLSYRVRPCLEAGMVGTKYYCIACVFHRMSLHPLIRRDCSAAAAIW